MSIAGSSGSRQQAFTLVEVLVSTVLVASIMVLLLGTVDQTQKLWQRTSTKASQFQASRHAFESMTRKLSQATLNTYWRAYDANSANASAEFQYRRHSELQFLSGPTYKIFSSPALTGGINDNPQKAYPLHSVFFQAPLGVTEETTTNGSRVERRFRGMDSFLSACGYFVEFGDDPDRPDFIKQSSAYTGPRYRYRLMELMVPAERLTIYRRPGDPDHNINPMILNASNSPYAGLVDGTRRLAASWVRPLWMQEALRRETEQVGKFAYARPIADNVVGLVILPKKSEKDREPGKAKEIGDLAPDYAYDSWRVTRSDADPSKALLNSARDNLLPPIVQVVMIAIDEPGAVRMDLQPATLPDWFDDVFKDVKNEEEFQEDLVKLEERLRDVPGNLNYRIFTTDVVIRGSKWSND